MMTAEQLRDAFRSSRKSVTITLSDFGEIRLTQMVVSDAMPLLEVAASFASKAVSTSEMAEFWVSIISKCVVDEAGELVFDSDEGRSIVRGLRIDWLTELGNAAVAINGIGEEKKSQS